MLLEILFPILKHISEAQKQMDSEKAVLALFSAAKDRLILSRRIGCAGILFCAGRKLLRRRANMYESGA